MIFFFAIPEFILILPVIIMVIAACAVYGGIKAFFPLFFKYWYIVLIAFVLKYIIECLIVKYKKLEEVKGYQKKYVKMQEELKKFYLLNLFVNILNCGALFLFVWRMENHFLILSALIAAYLFFFAGFLWFMIHIFCCDEDKGLYELNFRMKWRIAVFIIVCLASIMHDSLLTFIFMAIAAFIDSIVLFDE